ncbi:MAG: class B sortase [Clostridiales bacterium]|nr:class B sortase [Clostridiales bacterium]
MRKVAGRIGLIVCAAVFLVAVWNIVSILASYRQGEQLYTEAAAQYVQEYAQEYAPEQAGETGTAETGTAETCQSSAAAPEAVETPPISVDFDSLQAVNPEVVGWIYCPDTAINYPVLQGTDNEYYLNHLYDGTYNSSGSIFVDCNNSAGFADANIILYGHHMRNGSMFAGLEQFADQSYYEAHPVMWLLTPEKNYKILLLSGYTTSYDSDAYTIIYQPGQTMEDYLTQCLSNSDFTAQVDADGAEKLITLSTCAYSFENARYVLHGVMVEVGE